MNRRTTTEAELRQYVAAGKNWVTMAEETGMNVAVLRNAASALGIAGVRYRSRKPPRQPGRVAAMVTEQVQLYRALRKIGATYREIAVLCDVPKATVVSRLRLRAKKQVQA